MSLFVFLLVLFALLGIYWAMLKRFGLTGLQCTRRFSTRAVFEGESCELVEVVSNDRPLLVPWLRVESRVSPYVRFGRQENLDVSGDMYHRSLFTLMPYQRVTRRHRVRLTRRGVYNLGNATLTAGDAVAQLQCTREQHMDVPIIVYPRLLSEEEMPEPITQLAGEIARTRQLQQDPFLVRGVRPYQPGDPVRDIHWPATARMGQAQVRVHDDACQARLLVVLNGQLREDQWDELMDYEQDVIEREISMAATLCVQLVRAGLTAGFTCNLPMDDSRESAFVAPMGGAEQEERLLEGFARLRIRRTRAFNSFLEELEVPEGVDLLVLSPYDSEELQAHLAALRQAGSRVRLSVVPTEEAMRHAG